MPDADPWSLLPHRRLHIPLPGYRELPEYHTYEGTRVDELPPIPIELDDDCAWLMRHGTVYTRAGLDRYERGIQPAIIEELALRTRLELPRSFRRFMTSPELQSRVRSCTDCYLDPRERVVETAGPLRGHLLHFLSDSQSCAHWFLHILPGGETAILESPDLYCYQIENSTWVENAACRSEHIDLSVLDIAYCASSFSDFLYRFWIENEIWYVLEDEARRRPLNDLEIDYVVHYESRKAEEGAQPKSTVEDRR